MREDFRDCEMQGAEGNVLVADDMYGSELEGGMVELEGGALMECEISVFGCKGVSEE